MELGNKANMGVMNQLHTKVILEIRDAALSNIRTKVWDIIDEVWMLRITHKWS